MTSEFEPMVVPFDSLVELEEEPGIMSREVDVAGQRWAVVSYAPGSQRVDWCNIGHRGYVVSGEVTYEFQHDRRPVLSITAGNVFFLPRDSGHRGCNRGAVLARIFVSDEMS
jgi:hypothetical protein